MKEVTFPRFGDTPYMVLHRDLDYAVEMQQGTPNSLFSYGQNKECMPEDLL